MPCLAATYADLKGEATSEWAEAVEMIRPQPRDFIPGTAARMQWKADDRLMARIWSHFSMGNSSTGDTNWMPALFTSTSSRPKVDSARAIMPAI